MTPKEKAIELVDKFNPYVYCYSGSGMLINDYDERVALKMQKECALISINQTINEVGKNWLSAKRERLIDYWVEVKEEVIKL